MKKAFHPFITALLALALLLSLCACGSAPVADAATHTRTITDIYGRTVEIPVQVDSIVCTGCGALRMVSYLGAADHLAGIEECDKAYESSTKRDYAYVNYERFQDLPPIGKGGGSAYTAYPEAVIAAAPDVILSCYTQEAAEQLAAETGIPVVCVGYKSINFVDESFYTALVLTSEVLGQQERCDALLSFIDGCKQELNVRTQDIPDESKAAVYTGAVTFSGAHGFAGTYANFGPFLAVNAKNVADETAETGAFEVDLEQVLAWDPAVIFLDPGNMELVNEEYAANPAYFDALSAVQTGKVYAMPSFNNYSTNITYALMDAYYAGKVLYPDAFADIDMAEKSNEILTFFLGRGYYAEMAADGLGFGTLTIGA